MEEVSIEEILDLQRREQEARYEKNKLVAKALKERGYNVASELIQEENY